MAAALFCATGACRSAEPPVTLASLPAVASREAIDSAAAELMARESVQGLAVAVIDSGRVASVSTYGYRNVERKLPLTPRTVMYGASLTKAAIAYLVLQYVDEGKLSLDDSLPSLLPKPLPEYEDYAAFVDPRWRALTLRRILNHTTGFANFRWLEPDRVLRFHTDPGIRYGYSGEGFYLLQLVLEEHLKVDVGAEMQRRVFDRFGLTHTSMQWRADFAEDLADGYGLDGTMEPHDERSSVSAAGSMDTSIEDQARLWAGIVRGDGLTPSSRAELVRPQHAITSLSQFPTLRETSGGFDTTVALSAGLGVVTFQDPQWGPSWFKGGHNDFTGNMLICQERAQRCVVFLANDVRAERIYPELARRILGETAMPWAWEYGLEANR
jgi:CubicO group peptidase (beta-lactamase class C family)